MANVYYADGGPVLTPSLGVNPVAERGFTPREGPEGFSAAGLLLFADGICFRVICTLGSGQRSVIELYGLFYLPCLVSWARRRWYGGMRSASGESHTSCLAILLSRDCQVMRAIGKQTH